MSFSSARPTKVRVKDQTISFRSMIESQWFLFLLNARDVDHISYEPKDEYVDHHWLPDFSFYSNGGAYVAEVKYEPIWKPRQFYAAMLKLRSRKDTERKADRLAGILLLASEGRVYSYTEGHNEEKAEIHYVQWGELLTAYRRSHKGFGYLANPDHPRAGKILQSINPSEWRLFPCGGNQH